MAVDDQVKVLEDEFKLIKSELRQTLVSVRDFLLDLKLPPMPEEEVPLEELPVASSNREAEPTNQGDQNQSGQSSNGGDGTGGCGSDLGGSETGQDAASELIPATDETPFEEDSSMELEDLGVLDEDDNGMTSGDMPANEIEEEKEEKEQEEEPENVMPRVGKEGIPTIVSSESQINLLSNLIRWVNTAKSEIGFEQLVAFLDVYSIGGYLTEDIKGVILHLAQVATDANPEMQNNENGPYLNEQIALCMEINSLSGQFPENMKKSIRRLTEILLQQTVQRNKADVWSKLLLELHGILNGNAAALQALITKEKEEQKAKEEQAEFEKAEKLKAEEEKKKKAGKPAKLRLVLPGSDGNDQELDLGNLFIATELENNNGDGQRKLSFS